MSDKNTFEAAVGQLEDILEKLQDENVTLDESIDLYATAATLVKQCNERLENAQVRIDEISKTLGAEE